MASPTITVDLGFGATWKTLDAAIVWTDVSRWVSKSARCRVNRGRRREYDEIVTGEARLDLLNTDRRFDPTHTTGPYYGQLKPGVPIRVTATFDGVTYAVFRGFVDGWPQRYDRANQFSHVPVVARDGTEKLAKAALPSSVYAAEVEADAPHAWWRLAETRGNSMQDSSGNRYDGTYTDGATQLSERHPNQWETVPAIRWDNEHYAVVTNAAARPTDVPFVIEAIIRLPDPIPATHQPAIYSAGPGYGSLMLLALDATVDAGAGGGNLLGASAIGAASSATLAVNNCGVDNGATHHVAYRRTASAHDLYLDGVALAAPVIGTAGLVSHDRSFIAGSEYTGGGTVTSDDFTGSLADVAVYTTDIGAARIAAHANALHTPWNGDGTGARVTRILDLVGWPTDLRDIEIGDTALGSAVLGTRALAYLRDVEQSEQGRLFVTRDGKVRFLNRYHFLTEATSTVPQATFSDAGEIAPRAVDLDFAGEHVFNQIQGQRAGGATITVQDQTSIDQHGERTDDRSMRNMQVGTDAEVRSALEYRLDRYKDPQARVEQLVVDLHRSAAFRVPKLLALELGHRVTVRRTPQGVGAATVLDELVEGIEHTFDNHSWTTELTLSPVDTRTYWRWGTDAWGETARWGY